MKIPKDIELADPRFFESQPIEILLGMDIYGQLLCNGFIRLGKHQPVLINTFLGWTISGEIPVETKNYLDLQLTATQLPHILT